MCLLCTGEERPRSATVLETRAVLMEDGQGKAQGGLRGLRRLKKNHEFVRQEESDPGFKPSLEHSPSCCGLRSPGLSALKQQEQPSGARF